ncbi:MarC family integral membrane protein [uncultured archaeon]|nr:MarC family integral membrane protein [uncultured archaeon]
MLGFPLDPLIKCVVALFVIMDPLASLPVFLTLTRKQNDRQRRDSALIAAAVAGAVLVIFTLIGPALMSALSVSMPAFQIAGGVLILVMAVQSFLGIEIKSSQEKDLNVAAVVVGTPLLTGPGAMTTAVILAGQFGIAYVFTGATAVVLLTLAVLLLASPIHRLIGKTGLAVISKVMAILLAAVAVEFIKLGVQKILIEWALLH